MGRICNLVERQSSRSNDLRYKPDIEDRQNSLNSWEKSNMEHIAFQLKLILMIKLREVRLKRAFAAQALQIGPTMQEAQYGIEAQATHGFWVAAKIDSKLLEERLKKWPETQLEQTGPSVHTAQFG